MGAAALRVAEGMLQWGERGQDGWFLKGILSNGGLGLQNLNCESCQRSYH